MQVGQRLFDLLLDAHALALLLQLERGHHLAAGQPPQRHPEAHSGPESFSAAQKEAECVGLVLLGKAYLAG